MINGDGQFIEQRVLSAPEQATFRHRLVASLGALSIACGLLAFLATSSRNLPADPHGLFSAIAPRLLPLYFLVALGFAAGRLFKIDSAPVGTILVHVISPIVFLGAMVTSPIGPVHLALPILFLVLPTAICLLSRAVLGRALGEAERNLAGFMAGSANCGFFGVPAALALLPADAFGIYLLCVVGAASMRTRPATTLSPAAVKAYARAFFALYGSQRFTPSAWASH